jgi:hypothetical protein
MHVAVDRTQTETAKTNIIGLILMTILQENSTLVDTVSLGQETDHVYIPQWTGGRKKNFYRLAEKYRSVLM